MVKTRRKSKNFIPIRNLTVRTCNKPDGNKPSASVSQPIPATPRTLIRQNPALYSFKASPKTLGKSPRIAKVGKSLKRIVQERRHQLPKARRSLRLMNPFRELHANIQGIKSGNKASKGKKKNNPPISRDSMENILVLPSKNENYQPGDPRPIVIDGCNVAYAYGDALSMPPYTFLWRGLQLVLEFFSRRGHSEITIFVPRCRAMTGDPANQRIIEDLKLAGHVILTPSRPANSSMTPYVSYDDRYIVQYASLHGGIIVSNDNFQDLIGESAAMDEAIQKRVLKFNFVGKSTLMFPMDPLGKWGPSLKDFLRF